MKPLWSRCGDRELFWILMGCVLLLVFGLNRFVGAAEPDPALWSALLRGL